MAKLIISLITALAIAIPSFYAWKQSRDKKRAQKDHEKRIQEIRKSVYGGNLDVVKRELAKHL